MNFLGIDIGSTNVKCGVYSGEGELLCLFSAGYENIVQDGEKYVDMEALWENVKDMVKRSARECCFASVCVSSFGESFTVLDAEDNILVRPMMYTDKRGSEEAAETLAELGGEFIYGITGVLPQSMYSLYKLLWIKKHMPDKFCQADKILLIGDYIAYKLTGRRVIDYSLASRTGVFDLGNKCFSEEILSKCGVNPKLFSTPVPTGSIVAEISGDFKAEAGIKDSCKLIAGGHDQVMAAIGAGVFSPDACIDGMGTVECITAVFNERSRDIKMGRQGYTNVPYPAGGYCAYLLSYTCGSLINWFKKSLLNNTQGEAEFFKDIESKMPYSPTGILTLPYFDGAATPFQDINAKGAVIGLKISHTDSDLYKSLLEATAYEMKLNLEETAEYRVSPKRIIAAGGGAKSRAWLQIKADILNRRVYSLAVSEAGICGAAILSAKALGVYRSFEDCAKVFIRYNEPLKPDKAKVSEYEKLYKKYRKLYKTVKKLY